MLGGRDGWDAFPDPGATYGGAWTGPTFVLTHHPEDAQPANGVTFLDCDVAEAVRIGLEAAEGKTLEILSPTIGRQLLERGLVDELDLHISPVLLGDGIRLFDNPGGTPIALGLRNGDDPGPKSISATTRSQPPDHRRPWRTDIGPHPAQPAGQHTNQVSAFARPDVLVETDALAVVP